MKEKQIEQHLRDSIRKADGLAIKFLSPGFTGVPDRIVLMPKGRIYFVELKATGQQLRPRQIAVKNLIQKLGFDYRVFDSKEQINDFINEICS